MTRAFDLAKHGHSPDTAVQYLRLGRRDLSTFETSSFGGLWSWYQKVEISATDLDIVRNELMVERCTP